MLNGYGHGKVIRLNSYPSKLAHKLKELGSKLYAVQPLGHSIYLYLFYVGWLNNDILENFIKMLA